MAKQSSSLEQAYRKHHDCEITLKHNTFKNGTEHWSLRCVDCNKHIQYVTFEQALIIQKEIDANP